MIGIITCLMRLKFVFKIPSVKLSWVVSPVGYLIYGKSYLNYRFNFEIRIFV